VLLLDEPTNHLDLDMREALAEALSDYDGAIVMVSHDRHLIGLVCETFWRVADGHVEPFGGDLDEYAAWLRARSGSKQPEKPAKAAPAPPPPPPAAAGMAKKNPNAKKIGQLETRLAAIESECAHIAEELANPALYNSDGGGTLVVLTQRQQALAKEREGLESDLLSLYDA
jgi:ATP-binding cassette subfamily F protein 3